MSDKDLVIGVDLGGTHAYAGVVDASGEVLLRKETDIDISLDPETIIRKLILPTIKAAMDDNPHLTGSIKAIGMGLPGRIDTYKGICHYSPNFRWHDVHVTQPLEESLGIPAFILNDVKTAAMGEKHFGAGRGIPNFVMVAIGTGIGGGIVSDGKLLIGEHGAASEIGHITVDPDGHQCNCGNFGCMEAMASGPNIARRGRELMLENKDSALWGMTEHITDVSAKIIYEAALQGDPVSVKVWEDTGRYLGIGFASIAHVVDPRRFIIGGRVARAMDLFLPVLKTEFYKRATMIPKDSIEFVHAKLQENAGMVGSAALAFERLSIL